MVETAGTISAPLASGDLVDRYWYNGEIHWLPEPALVRGLRWTEWSDAAVTLDYGYGVRQVFRRYPRLGFDGRMSGPRELVFHRTGEFGPAAWPSPAYWHAEERKERI